MHVTTHSFRDSQIISISSSFNEQVASTYRALFEKIAADIAGTVYLDMSRVELIDSSGIGMVAFLFKRLAAKNRHLVLVGLHGQPKRLMQWLRIDRVIESRDRLPEGAQGFQPSAADEKGGAFQLEEVA